MPASRDRLPRSLLVAGTIVLLGVVALGAAAPRASDAVADGPINVWLLPTGLVLGVVAGLAVVIAVVVLLRHAGGVPLPRVRGGRAAPWALVVAVGGAYLLVRLFGHLPGLARLLDLLPDPDPTTAAAASGAREVVYDPPTAALVVAGAVVAAVALAVARRRRSDDDADPARTEAAVAAARDDAAAVLLADPEPRRAVVGAWLAFEGALDAAGLPRREPEAPREYADRVVGAGRADAAGVAELARLYEVARFSPHPVDEPMRRRALEALGRVVPR